ncbi:peptidase inhibitor family I36 protein [Kitasatospora sp. NPDC008115]|uniref:peptidase inhibitor family I36 protein n=1 Tax=Kitasatospora sp. NPDC008115 TaxID=3364022 RepID=UPI0036E0246D
MRARFTRILAVFATTAAALTISVASAGTAAADDNSVIVCRNAHFNDCTVGGAWVTDPVRNIHDGGRFQDSISSIINASGSRLCFWEHNGFQGQYIRLDAGQQFADLGVSGFNDRISSWKAC